MKLSDGLRTVFLAGVGAVAVTGEKAKKLVDDLVKKGELKRSEARFASNKNVITRALGSEPVVEADFFEVPIEDGTRIFMCTDGVSNMMDDRTMESILNEYKNPVDACTVLVNTARDNGGRDDATAMIIDI